MRFVCLLRLTADEYKDHIYVYGVYSYSTRVRTCSAEIKSQKIKVNKNDYLSCSKAKYSRNNVRVCTGYVQGMYEVCTGYVRSIYV